MTTTNEIIGDEIVLTTSITPPLKTGIINFGSDLQSDRDSVAKSKKILQNFITKLKDYPISLSIPTICVLRTIIQLTKEDDYKRRLSVNQLPKKDQDIILASLPTDKPGNTSTTFEIKYISPDTILLEFKMNDSIGNHGRRKDVTYARLTVADINERDFSSRGQYTGLSLHGNVDVNIDAKSDKIVISGHGGEIQVDSKCIANVTKKATGVFTSPSATTRSISVEGGIKETSREGGGKKNAFEIRADVLNMALQFATNHVEEKVINSGDIVNIAKTFYEFVENKK